MPRSLRFVAALGWVMFAAGVVTFVLFFFRFGGSSVPKAKWRSRWGQPRWITSRDPVGRFLVDHPSNWDFSAPFERFTRRRIGEFVSVDTLALRRGGPVGLFVVIRYVAPAKRPDAAWLKETRPGGALSDAFGSRVVSRQEGRLAGIKGLRIIAEDDVAGKRYRLESWFLPAGDMAYRLTSAAPRDEFPEVEATLRRIEASFRFLPAVPVTPTPTSSGRVEPAAPS